MLDITIFSKEMYRVRSAFNVLSLDYFFNLGLLTHIYKYTKKACSYEQASHGYARGKLFN